MSEAKTLALTPEVLAALGLTIGAALVSIEDQDDRAVVRALWRQIRAIVDNGGLREDARSQSPGL